MVEDRFEDAGTVGAPQRSDLLSLPSRDGRQIDFFETCRMCKNVCCRGARPPITARRREAIEEYMRVRGISLGSPFVDGEYTFPSEDEDGYCVFYDRGSGRCIVHPFKPETCVAGPVTFDVNTGTGKIEWYLKTEEACPLAGVMARDKAMLEKHLEAARREIQRLLRELSPEALRAIIRIEEPETFKIGEEDAGGDLLSKLQPEGAV
jgi:Fe-S-cluster containining protein